MTTYTPEPQRQVHFGTLSPRTPQGRALDAIGLTVPALETRLGFPVSVTAEARPEGTLLAQVLLPDEHYSFEAILTISDALHDAVRPFGVDLDIVPDSDAPYAE